MKKSRSALAALLSAALILSSSPAPSAFAQVVAKPAAPTPVAIFAAPAPAGVFAQAPSTAAARPGFFEEAPLPAAREKARASSGLRRMSAELSAGAAPESLGRFYTGERGLGRSAEPVLAAVSEAAPELKAAPKAKPAPPAKEVPKPVFAVGGTLGTGGIVAIAAAVAAAVFAGLWTWWRGKSKNDAFENSKSNQDVIALEKARRDGDAAKLEEIAGGARARQGRMQERVDNARSAGKKKIDLGEGKDISVKEGETYAAFDGLVSARAALNGNAVSKDPARRIGGELPATWTGRLAGLEQGAAQSEDEGPLALQPKALGGELAAQDKAAARFEADIRSFDDKVPGFFGGRLKEMAQRARKDLQEFASAEVAPEKAAFSKFNGAMRGRVSGRLSERDAEYQQHLARLESLTGAAEGTLLTAVEMARKADKDMEEMAQHEKSRAFNLLLASQNEHVAVPVYDKQGNQVDTVYEDHSAMYKALVAQETAAAQASAASARANMQALSTIIPLLHKDPTLKAEGLTFALPSKSNTSVHSNGSVLFDFWLPASWNFFMTMFSESQANQARAGFAPVKGGLESVLSEVQARRQGEVRWTDGRIDAVLNAQMQKAQGR